MRHILIASFILFAVKGFAQESRSVSEFFSKWTIKPVAAGQIWGSYTDGARLYFPDSMSYEEVDGRANFVIRRTRLGAVISPSENITFNLVAAMDNVGRDVLAGPTGGVNNGAFPNVGLWNAFVQWKAIKNKELLHVIFGYHSPIFSRESLTAWHSVSSLDKSFSQFYIRRHLTGKNPGRNVGLTLGGQAPVNDNNTIGLQYSFGIFNSVFGAVFGNSSGAKSSPLLTGKLSVYVGQPESSKYKLGTRFNTLSKRKGVTLGISGSHAGQSDLFKSSYAIAVDLLWNHGPINIGGEWAWLRRDGDRLTDINTLRSFTVGSQAGFIRASYNFKLPKEQILEVGGTYMRFEGPSSEEGIADALAVNSAGGLNTAFDIGIIWHLIEGRFKVELHGTLQDGNPGEAGRGVVVNDFFAQSGVGIQKGDYVGLGVIFVL